MWLREYLSALFREDVENQVQNLSENLENTTAVWINLCIIIKAVLSFRLLQTVAKGPSKSDKVIILIF